jgi:3-oxoacyl-[acyl-carrier protein] reductase
MHYGGSIQLSRYALEPHMSDRKTAIITGAGSGIGRAAALLLAGQDYDLVLVGRSIDKLNGTRDQIRSQRAGQIGNQLGNALGGQDTAKYISHSGDITDPSACQNIIDLAAGQLGRIDALLNIAGFASVQTMDQVTPELWRTTIDTNLSAVVNLTAAAWPIFKKQNAGFVANVSSMASVDPFPGLWMYAAAKIGVNMWTQCIAREGEAINVNAVCVAPGAVETPMLRALFDEQTLPADATLPPENIAQVIVDCISGQRTFDRGETIVLPSP